jgi:hypothetical protein
MLMFPTTQPSPEVSNDFRAVFLQIFTSQKRFLPKCLENKIKSRTFADEIRIKATTLGAASAKPNSFEFCRVANKTQ